MHFATAHSSAATAPHFLGLRTTLRRSADQNFISHSPGQQGEARCKLKIKDFPLLSQVVGDYPYQKISSSQPTITNTREKKCRKPPTSSTLSVILRRKPRGDMMGTNHPKKSKHCDIWVRKPQVWAVPMGTKKYHALEMRTQIWWHYHWCHGMCMS